MVAGAPGCLSPHTDVLVVGAGPTGLTTALMAHDNGAAVRVVERRPEAVRPSRAMIIFSQTLESLRPLGVTEQLLERADRTPRAELHLGRRRVSLPLADMGLCDTTFPNLTLLRQMDVERVLASALRQRGIEVERGVEFVAASTGAEASRVTLRTGDRLQQATCGFLVGCDGPASLVRTRANISWSGRSYREEVLLADVEMSGDLAPGMLHAVVDRRGLVFLFALGERATWRLLATRPGGDAHAPFGQPGGPVPLSDLAEVLARAGLGVTITDLRWSARVRLQHRLARQFRHGRIFLAGDAAHAHSPAAAQGMNTGIQDAVNLGWKLAFAAGNQRHGSLLNSYEQERRPVARQILALTHIVFVAEASTHPLPAMLRGTLAPLTAPAAPILFGRPLLMAPVTQLLGQRWVHYRRSPLSVQGNPPGRRTQPGDRLPDREVTCDGSATRLHELIAGPGVHVLLERDAEDLRERPPRGHVAVHRVSSWPGRGLLAVRPDGYVGLRCGESDPRRLQAWLDLVAAG